MSINPMAIVNRYRASASHPDVDAEGGAMASLSPRKWPQARPETTTIKTNQRNL